MAIPYGKQYIDEDDLKEVMQTLTSEFLTQGPKVEQFEREFSAKTGARHSVAVSNGTAGLHLACMALGVEEGNTVLTTPNTFAATANAVLYNRGAVEFVDIDPDDFLIDLNLLEHKLKTNPGKYRGIITVDFAGKLSALKELRFLADKYGTWLLRDAAHSLGANGERAPHADASIYSFHPVKHITTGEGGMVTASSDVLAKKIKMLRTHGITKDSADYVQPGMPAWYHEMQMLGFNYRLCDIQAALGLSQLRKLDRFLERRYEIAASYDSFFTELGIQFQQKGSAEHAYHLYVIQHEKRDALYRFLRERGIYCQVHYIPVCNHPHYRNLGFQPEDYPNAQNYFKKTLSIPMYYSLTDEELGFVQSTIREFAGQHGNGRSV